MNKRVKYFAIGLAIFLILLIVSASIYGISFLYNIVTDKEEIIEVQPTKYLEERINALDIKLSASKLTITKGENNTLDTNNKYVKMEIKDGILYIKEEKHKLFRKNKFVVNITLQDNIYDSIKLESGAGKFNIDSLRTNNLDFQFGAGAGVINNLEVYKNAKIESGVGSVQILDGELNNLDLDVGVGKFILNSDIKGKSKIEAGIGSLNINIKQPKENYTVSIDKGIGSIKIDGEKSKNNNFGNGINILDIDGGIGSISINFNTSNTKIENNVIINVLEYIKNKDDELILIGNLVQGNPFNGMEIELYQNEEMIKVTTLIDETNRYTNKTINNVKIGEKVYIKIKDLDENMVKKITKIKSINTKLEIN